MTTHVILKVKGPNRDETVEVSLSSTQVFTVGRKDCDLNVEDKRVSRRHLSLSFETGELVADDLGSHNGTLCRGEKISTQTLGVGDTLELGDHSITVVAIAPPKTTTPSLAASPNVAEFSFYRSRTVTWNAIRETYLVAIKRWKAFWQEVDYGIPVETSLPILATLGGVYGIVAAIHGRGMIALLAAASVAATTIGMVAVVAALIAALRKWLQAEGDFDGYVVFGVYFVFLYLPVMFVTTLLGKAIFSGAAAIFSLWAFSGFVKAFKPNLLRFVGFLLAVIGTMVGTLGAVFYVIYTVFRAA